jgi:hypothetical protein
MAVDATDLGALEKALNDAAGKASVLWTPITPQSGLNLHAETHRKRKTLRQAQHGSSQCLAQTRIPRQQS